MGFSKHKTWTEKFNRMVRYHALRSVGYTRNQADRFKDWRVKCVAALVRNKTWVGFK